MNTDTFSKKDALLQHLLEGNTITQLEGIVVFGIPQITREMARFRRNGWVVKRKKVTYAKALANVNRYAQVEVPKNLDTKNITLTEYWISQ